MRLALRKEKKTQIETKTKKENKKTRKWKRKLGVTWFLYMSSMYGCVSLHSLVTVCVC